MISGFSITATKWRTHCKSLRAAFAIKGLRHKRIKLVRHNRSAHNWKSYLNLVWQVEGYELHGEDFK